LLALIIQEVHIGRAPNNFRTARYKVFASHADKTY